MSNSIDLPETEGIQSADFKQTNLLPGIQAISGHNHLALLYESKEEQLGATIPFIRRGIEVNHRCLYMADENSPSDIRAALNDAGIDADLAEKHDQLIIESVGDTYLNDGFDADEMLDYLVNFTKESLDQGFDGLHVTGEMSWTLNAPVRFDAIMEYEAKYDQVASEHPVTALCQYNLERFKSDSIIDVIHTHPRLIYRGRICDNPYYTPPEEFLGTSRPDIEAKRMLETTYDLAAARDGIRKREQRLEVINRVLRHNIRNDLNVILGHSELLTQNLDDPSSRESAQQINNTAMKLFEIAKSARHVEESLKNESSSDTTQCINEIIEDVVTQFKAVNHNTTIELDTDGDIWVEASEDLKFAFNTLLDSLQEYTGTIQIQVKKTGGVFTTTDIEIQTVDSILPDLEVDALTSGRETPLQHSKGIGLWVVNWIVEQSDGSLSISQTESGSSKIDISLPSCRKPRYDQHPTED